MSIFFCYNIIILREKDSLFLLVHVHGKLKQPLRSINYILYSGCRECVVSLGINFFLFRTRLFYFELMFSYFTPTKPIAALTILFKSSPSCFEISLHQYTTTKFGLHQLCLKKSCGKLLLTMKDRMFFKQYRREVVSFMVVSFVILPPGHLIV